MNKYIYNLWMLIGTAIVFTACSADEGTMPGSDSNPVVTVYQYEPGAGYDADSDLKVRFVANSATENAYYLVQKADEYDAYVQANGEQAYADYVIANGVKLDAISGFSNQEVMMTELYGDCMISAVAVRGNVKNLVTSQFSGLVWNDIAEGTYTFSSTSIGTTAQVMFQKCGNQEGLYRFKDLYAKGYSLKVTTLDMFGKDENGQSYQYLRIPLQDTPFNVTAGGVSYGLKVSDVGYWQENDAYITQGGYEGQLYENNEVYLVPVYYVPGVGKLTGPAYGYFIPD